jgi:hypothetical protein
LSYLSFSQVSENFSEKEKEEAIKNSSDLKEVSRALMMVFGVKKDDPEDSHQIVPAAILSAAVIHCHFLEDCSVFLVDAIGQLYFIDFETQPFGSFPPFHGLTRRHL